MSYFNVCTKSQQLGIGPFECFQLILIPASYSPLIQLRLELLNINSPTKQNKTKLRNAPNSLAKCEVRFYDFLTSSFGKGESNLAKMENLFASFFFAIPTDIYRTYLFAATAATDASKPVLRIFPPKAPPTRLTWHMILLAGTPKLAATISCKTSFNILCQLNLTPEGRF